MTDYVNLDHHHLEYKGNSKDVVVDIVSMKVKDHRIKYQLNRVIRDDALYKLEQVEPAQETYFVSIVSKNQRIIHEWNDNKRMKCYIL